MCVTTSMYVMLVVKIHRASSLLPHSLYFMRERRSLGTWLLALRVEYVVVVISCLLV